MSLNINTSANLTRVATRQKIFNRFFRVATATILIALIVTTGLIYITYSGFSSLLHYLIATLVLVPCLAIVTIITYVILFLQYGAYLSEDEEYIVYDKLYF